MGKVYINSIPVNNGVRLNGATPLDDRLVLSDISDVYISAENPKDCVLYGRIYKGAQISVYQTVDDVQKVVQLILEDDTPYIQGHPVTVTEQNIYQYWKNIERDAHEDIINNTYYHQTDAASTDSTLVPHGCMDIGVTPAELQTMTFSQILEKILFEFCKPSKQINSSFSISATGDYATGKAVEVGSTMPAATNLSNAYQAEVWYWVSKQDPNTHGDAAALSVKGTVEYMYNEIELASGGVPITDPSYTNKRVVDGINGYIYATCTQTAGTRPKDSRGNLKDPETGNYYANPITTKLTSSNIVSFTGAWYSYSNAGWTGTNLNTAWERRNTEPGEFKGNDAKDVVDNLLFYQTTVTLYFQWPSGAQGGSATAQFHVYCPDSYRIQTVKGANNTTPAYDIPATFELASTLMPITNSLGARGNFKNYTISHAAGITNMQIVFKKV